MVESDDMYKLKMQVWKELKSKVIQVIANHTGSSKNVAFHWSSTLKSDTCKREDLLVMQSNKNAEN